MVVKKDKKEDEEEKGQKPVMSVNIGAFQASVFLNEVESNGKKIKVPSTTFQKSFTKGDGNWQRQKINFFNTSEIDKAITVLQQIKTALYEKSYEEEKE